VLAGRLVAEGSHVRVWDPIARMNGLDAVDQVESVDAAVAGADAVVLVTEWPELADIDWRQARTTAGSNRPVFVDGRNMLDPDRMRAAGWVYESIGRPSA
jgi:UDPglucose 6-dehydrogenase